MKSRKKSKPLERAIENMSRESTIDLDYIRRFLDRYDDTDLDPETKKLADAEWEALADILQSHGIDPSYMRHLNMYPDQDENIQDEWSALKDRFAPSARSRAVDMNYVRNFLDRYDALEGRDDIDRSAIDREWKSLQRELSKGGLDPNYVRSLNSRTNALKGQQGLDPRSMQMLDDEWESLSNTFQNRGDK